VVADIPGLIEGASEGHGLGIRFLKHVERTLLLLHLVDISGYSGRSAVNDFDVVMRELENFSPEMLEKPMLVLGTKLDSMGEPTELDALRAHVTAKGFEFFAISSLAGQGMKDLLHRVEALVLKPLEPFADEDDDESEEEASEEYGIPPHLTDEEEQLPGGE